MEGYYLIIRNGKDGEEYIALKNQQIKEYSCILNSKDEVLEKDSDIIPELHISGTFRDEDGDVIFRLIEWSLAKSEKSREAYRYLEFGYIADDMIKRQYIFPDAFVVDFSEEIKNDSKSHPIFTLFIKQFGQRKDKFSMNVCVPLPENYKDDKDE